MRPKFEVGEVVVLQSKHRPECNGEFSVIEVHSEAEGAFPFEGASYHVSEGHYGYFLTDDALSSCGEGKAFWAECALRKKHQPGELSFDSLMHSLSSPKLITAG